MAHVLKMADGKNEVVLGFRDFCELVDTYMGTEARAWLEEYLSDAYGEDDELAFIEDEHRKELDGLREHFRGVISEIREQSELLAGLIRTPEIDRNAVSRCCGKIGTITWREC